MTGPDTLPLDEALLRSTAENVLTGLPADLADEFAARYATLADLTEAMVRTGERVWRHLRKRDRAVPRETYPAFALALLSMRRKPYDVQQNLGHIVTQYDRMVSWGDIPLGIAAQSRTIRDDLAEGLITASRVADKVGAERPAVPPFHIGMVTSAVFTLLSGEVADLTEKVLAALRRADLLAARRGSAKGLPGRSPRW